MNCPNCGLLIGQGNMSTTLPLCQCHWQIPQSGRNSLDKMEDYDRLAKLCEKQAQEIAAQLNTIKSLNLLVELETTKAIQSYKQGIYETELKYSRMEAVVRYMKPNSQKWSSADYAAFSVMADECRSSKLFDFGDAILVWVNEGDIIHHGKLIQSAPVKEGD